MDRCGSLPDTQSLPALASITQVDWKKVSLQTDSQLASGNEILVNPCTRKAVERVLRPEYEDI